MHKGGVCIVLGGANGVGRQCVEKWAKNGRRVAYIDIDKASGKALRDKLMEEWGVEVFFFHGDVRNEEDMDIFRSVVEDRYGKIECFLCNIPSFQVNYQPSTS